MSPAPRRVLASTRKRNADAPAVRLRPRRAGASRQSSGLSLSGCYNQPERDPRINLKRGLGPCGTESPMHQPRDPFRWDTDFGRWVRSYGVGRIVQALGQDPDLRVTSQSVYEWLQGHAPRPPRAAALVRLSEGCLTLEAIYGHRSQLEALGREDHGDAE